MRYLAIDYGLKRIGVAVSDEDGRMAFPAGVIINHGTGLVIKKINERIKNKSIDVIVVGVPIGLDSSETEQTDITRLFIASLKKVIRVPIETENEMFTSRMASAAGMRDGHIDATSAAIILQSYLDRINRKK